MLTRIFNYIKNIYKNQDARKEKIMDGTIIGPYISTDSLLFITTFYHSIAQAASDPSHPENDSWYDPTYYIGTIFIISMLVPSLFFAFSETTGRMLGIQDNEYRKSKASVRKIIGLPGSLTKIMCGDLSLYTYLVSSNISKELAVTITCTTGFIALPAIVSFLWSDHDKSTNEQEPSDSKNNVITVRRALAYSSALCYSVVTSFPYYGSALCIPQKLGLIDYPLSRYHNNVEHAAYLLIIAGTGIQIVATFLAFARLSTAKLVHEENDVEESCWVDIKDHWIKKSIGSFAVLFKIFNTAVSAYTFFKDKIPLGANIPFVAYSSTAGLLAQGSLLIRDPLKEPEKNDLDDVQDDDLESKESNTPRITPRADGERISLASFTVFNEIERKTSNVKINNYGSTGRSDSIDYAATTETSRTVTAIQYVVNSGKNRS